MHLGRQVYGCCKRCWTGSLVCWYTAVGGLLCSCVLYVYSRLCTPYWKLPGDLGVNEAAVGTEMCRDGSGDVIVVVREHSLRFV